MLQKPYFKLTKLVKVTVFRILEENIAKNLITIIYIIIKINIVSGLASLINEK